MITSECVMAARLRNPRQSPKQQRLPSDVSLGSLCRLFRRPEPRSLLTQAESLDQVTVTLNVVALQVVEQRAALTYQLHQ